MIGGPLIPKIYRAKDRTFFLFSWESLREVTGSSAIGVVPTASQRAKRLLAIGRPDLRSPDHRHLSRFHR